MASSSWSLKRQAALTLGFVTTAASGPMLAEHLGTILTLLTEALAGRVWKGIYIGISFSGKKREEAL